MGLVIQARLNMQRLFVLFPVVLGLTACGGEPDPNSPYESDEPIAPPTNLRPLVSEVDAGPECVDGEVGDCVAYSTPDRDRHNCITGVRLCTDGEWGPCQY
jgi:hypothetical protein